MYMWDSITLWKQNLVYSVKKLANEVSASIRHNLYLWEVVRKGCKLYNDKYLRAGLSQVACHLFVFVFL